MLSYFKRPDIPFSREDANRYLPWVIGVMVCLVGVMVALGVSLHQASSRAGQLNIQSFQVYLPHSIASDELMLEVSEALIAFESVEQLEPVGNEALQSLVAPWTGEQLALEELPLPRVLEVTLKHQVDRAQALPHIEQRLKAINPDIDMESYQDWVDQLMQFTGMLKFATFGLVGLLLAALMSMVAIVVRTSLKLHFPTVRLLHHVGATDDYIIEQFVANGCLMTFKGSVMGMGAATLVVVGLSYISLELSSPLLPSFVLSFWHGLVIVILPLIIVALSFVVVRTTILNMLEQMH